MRLKLSTALTVLLIMCLTIALTASSLIAWMRLATIGDLPGKMGQARIAQIQRIADIRFGVTDAASSLRLAMLAKTPEELEKSIASIVATRDQVDRTMSMWRLNIATPSGEERFQKFERTVATFWRLVETDVGHLEAGRKDDALASLMLDTTPVLVELYSVLEREQDRQGHVLSASIATVEEIAWDVRNHMLVWIAAILAGLLTAFWFAVRSLRERKPKL